MKKSVKKLLRLSALAASASLVLVGCSTSNFDEGKPSADGDSNDSSSTTEETIKVGAILNVTGPNASIGGPQRDAIQMLADQLNEEGFTVDGKKLELIVKDDQSTPDGAAKAATQLIENDKVDLIIGSSTTGPSLAIRSLTEEQGIPTISLASNIAVVQDSEWVFKSAQNDVVVLEVILNHMQESGIEKVALVRDSSGFGEGVADHIRTLGESRGIELLAEETYDGTDTDFTAQMTRVKSLDADAVVLWGLNPAIGLVQKAYVQHGVNLPVYHGHGVANDQFFEKAGSDANGAFGSQGRILVVSQLAEDDPQKPVIEKFNTDFSEKYGSLPDSLAGHGYDALLIAADALQRAGSSDPAAIRDAIESTTDLVGISGIFNMSADNHSGLDTSALIIAEAADGQWTLAK